MTAVEEDVITHQQLENCCLKFLMIGRLVSAPFFETKYWRRGVAKIYTTSWYYTATLLGTSHCELQSIYLSVVVAGTSMHQNRPFRKSKIHLI